MVKLDQHFVIDKNILERITKLAKIAKNDIILEIGAGTGNLTKFLLEKAGQVHAIELDKTLLPELKELKNSKLNIISGNALNIKFPEFNKLVANVPYSISEPLIQKLIYNNFKLGVLLLPEKFVKKITSKNTKLSLISNIFFEICEDIKVSPGCFSPKPHVFSRIILLKPKKIGEPIFADFLKQKNKKVKNALREAIIREKGTTKKEAKELLKNRQTDKKVASLSLRELERIQDFVRNLNV